jgi:mannitol/fructose-specific phosphotransferase system IIA component
LSCPFPIKKAVWLKPERWLFRREGMMRGPITREKLKKPIDWGATDGQPTSVVVLLALRESASGAEHMQVFSQLARRLMHEEFRKSVLGSASADSLMRFLAGALSPNSPPESG